MSDEDATSSSTLLLREMPAEHQPLAGQRTEKMRAVTVAPVDRQRCPRCGAAVTITDDACGACDFNWGGFRATSHTDVRKGVMRRRHERYAVELQLVYISSELEIEATSLDLSPSGVFVCSQVLDPVGTACKLTLLVDGGPPLEIGGIVRRVVDHDDSFQDQCGLGVEFTNVGATAQAWLEAVIARQAAIEAD